MNLKAAVESGKPFRHKTWSKFRTADDVLGRGELSAMTINADHAISDEWEIQAKQTFTREDVMRAVRSAMAATFDSGYVPSRVFEEAMRAAEDNNQQAQCE